MASLDNLWIIISACFVFFMQAGFICYEVGFVQAKNVVSVAIENILAFVIATLVFCLWGYGLMFGPTFHGLWGNWFALLGNLTRANNLSLFAHLLFQLMFAGTAVTIFAGSMSERTKLNSLVVAAIITAGFIYPLYGHWVWGGNYSAQTMWLKGMGFIDFAGATVVHATAGWVALAGIIVVGARRGRFDASGKIQKLGRSNIPFATLGTFILWFGWFGFNGGSVLKFDESIGLILINTNLAASAGVVGAILITWLFTKDRSLIMAIFSGALGGLVAITAGSNVLTPLDSCLVGLIAGAVVVFSTLFLERLRLDDAVGVVPIHAFGGATGTILLALLSPTGYLVRGSRLLQLQIQTAGVLTNFAWSFGIGLIVFYVLKKTVGLRVTPEQEEQGLNIVEYNDIYSWVDFRKTMRYENMLYEQNQMLKRQSRLLIATQEQERVKLGRDLHDGVGQSLAAVKLQLGMLINKVKGITRETALEKEMNNTLHLVESAVEEMRGVIMNLRPAFLRERGLEETIRNLAGNIELSIGLSVVLHVEDPVPVWSEAVELNIYRIFQESLANVIKHASAARVELLFQKQHSNCYIFSIIDDGVGFYPDAASGGIGLLSMRERASLLSGRLDIRSSPGSGTIVILEVPIGQDTDIDC